MVYQLMISTTAFHWLSLLHNFFQRNLNSGSTQAQNPRGVWEIYDGEDRGPDWKRGLTLFVSQPFRQNNSSSIHLRHQHYYCRFPKETVSRNFKTTEKYKGGASFQIHGKQKKKRLWHSKISWHSKGWNLRYSTR